MQKFFRWLMSGVIFYFFVGITGQAAPVGNGDFLQGKVDAVVLSLAAEGETEFLVFLREQADLSGAAALGSKGAKGFFVYETLV